MEDSWRGASDVVQAKKDTPTTFTVFLNKLLYDRLNRCPVAVTKSYQASCLKSKNTYLNWGTDYRGNLFYWTSLGGYSVQCEC